MGLKMNDQENINLRMERLALLIGSIVGSLSNLLNQIGDQSVTLEKVYRQLRDMNEMAGIQLHELYYKGTKREQ